LQVRRSWDSSPRGAATQKYMQQLADQQEVMGAIADMIIEVFAMESAILRAEKLSAKARLRFGGDGAYLCLGCDGEDRAGCAASDRHGSAEADMLAHAARDSAAAAKPRSGRHNRSASAGCAAVIRAGKYAL